MLAGEGSLEPLFHKLLAGLGDRIDAGIQRRRDLGVSPPRPRRGRICLQQDVRLQQRSCRMFALINQSVKFAALVITQPHDVFLQAMLFRGHDSSPS